MAYRIVITETLDAKCADWLAEQPDVELQWASLDDPAGFRAMVAQADGLIVRTYTQVNSDLLDLAPKLKVVGRAGVGLDNFDLEACSARDVRVVYTPDANTQAVVEYVTALMLDAYRPRVDLTGPTSAEAFHHLRKTAVGSQIETLTLGVLGFGRIGKRIGEVAHAIGMNVYACDLLPEVQLRKAVRYPFDYLTFEQLLRRSDVVTVHVDGRPENRHLIDAKALAMLRPHCMLINAARGNLVDAAALADWLGQTEHTGGRAVLDVHDPEPPRDDYCLYGLPNVRLLPHLASRTDVALKNMSWVVRDVLSVLRGELPDYPAN